MLKRLKAWIERHREMARSWLVNEREIERQSDAIAYLIKQRDNLHNIIAELDLRMQIQTGANRPQTLTGTITPPGTATLAQLHANQAASLLQLQAQVFASKQNQAALMNVGMGGTGLGGMNSFAAQQSGTQLVGVPQMAGNCLSNISPPPNTFTQNWVTTGNDQEELEPKKVEPTPEPTEIAMAKVEAQRTAALRLISEREQQ